MLGVRRKETRMDDEQNKLLGELLILAAVLAVIGMIRALFWSLG